MQRYRVANCALTLCFGGRSLYLHCRACTVTEVRVHGAPAEFEHHSFLEDCTPEDAPNEHGAETKSRDLMAYNINFRSEASASDAGDLVITLSEEVRAVLETTTTLDYKAFDLDVTVRWRLDKPHAGVVFSEGLPTEGSSPEDVAAHSGVEATVIETELPSGPRARRAPHVFTCSKPGGGGGSFYGCCGPRTWFPCVDTLASRCTYQLSVSASCVDYESCTVAASGDLERIVDDHWQGGKHGGGKGQRVRRHDFAIRIPVCAYSVCIAAGALQMRYAGFRGPGEKISSTGTTRGGGGGVSAGRSGAVHAAAAAAGSTAAQLGVTASTILAEPEFAGGSSLPPMLLRAGSEESLTSAGQWMPSASTPAQGKGGAGNAAETGGASGGSKAPKVRAAVMYNQFAPYTLYHILEPSACGLEKVCEMIGFFENYLEQPYPFRAFNQVFVEGTHHDVSQYAGGAAFSTSTMHPGGIVEPVADNLRRTALAVISNWFGCVLGPAHWTDSWVLVGIQGFLVDLFLGRGRGQSDAQHRLQSTMEACVRLEDECPFPLPLHPTGLVAEEDPLSSMPPQWDALVALKAPLVCHLLHTRLGDADFRTAIKTLMKDALAAHRQTLLARNQHSNAMTGTPFGNRGGGSMGPGGASLGGAASTRAGRGDAGARAPQRLDLLSTARFLRVLRTSTEKSPDLAQFRRQWIDGVGMPHFRVSYKWDRLRHRADVTFEQVVSPGRPIFVGPITIVMHETDERARVKYHEHTRQVSALRHLWQFEYHGTAAPLKKAKAKFNIVENSPILWMRVDPHFGWLRSLAVNQQQEMWLNQLEHSEDINSEVTAVWALSRFPRDIEPEGDARKTVNALRTVIVDRGKTFDIGVRQAAAFALARWQSTHAPPTEEDAVEELGKSWDGLRALIEIYQARYFQYGHPKPLYFAHLSDYELRKALLSAIARVRCQEGDTPAPVLRFLLTVINAVDNSGNPFSEAPFVALAVKCLASAMADVPVRALLNRATHKRERSGADASGAKRSRVDKAATDELAGSSGDEDDDEEDNTTGGGRGESTGTDNDESEEDDIEESDRLESEGAAELVVRGYEVLRRILDIDATRPSFDRMVTAQCLRSMGELAVRGIVTRPPHFHLYCKADMPLTVRLAAIESMLQTYVINNPIARNGMAQMKGRDLSRTDLEDVNTFLARVAHWLQRLDYVLMVAAADPDPRVVVAVVLHLHRTHLTSAVRSCAPKKALTTDDLEKVPAGALGAWSEEPLSGGCLSLLNSSELFHVWGDQRVLSAGAAVVERLWRLLNEGSATRWRLRRAAYFLYNSMFGLNQPLPVHQYAPARSAHWPGDAPGNVEREMYDKLMQHAVSAVERALANTARVARSWEAGSSVEQVQDAATDAVGGAGAAPIVGPASGATLILRAQADSALE